MQELAQREKTILAGLFLSKFDTRGLDRLGFENFTEAFNAIGISLGVRPASVKNYRDEFDPAFPNRRQGWHKRAMRPHCRRIYETFKDLDMRQFSTLLKRMVYENGELDVLVEDVAREEDRESSFARRLITGQAAERYFREHYSQVDVFRDYALEDTTNAGCGFDFKLYADDKEFLAVEVKGLSQASGPISLTNKEYLAAKVLKKRYFLFVVRNFRDIPFHDFFANPLSGPLAFKRLESTITQISWNAYI
jgi:aromatic ring-cleaving dioxygenase